MKDDFLRSFPAQLLSARYKQSDSDTLATSRALRARYKQRPLAQNTSWTPYFPNSAKRLDLHFPARCHTHLAAKCYEPQTNHAQPNCQVGHGPAARCHAHLAANCHDEHQTNHAQQHQCSTIHSHPTTAMTVPMYPLPAWSTGLSLVWQQHWLPQEPA